MADETYYTVLGVSETASQQEIRAAYRSLLKKIHPDNVATQSAKVRCDAEQLTKEINEAYSVLSHADMRGQYDQQLEEYRQQADQVSPSPSDSSSVASGPHIDFSVHHCGAHLDGRGHCLRCARAASISGRTSIACFVLVAGILFALSRGFSPWVHFVAIMIPAIFALIGFSLLVREEERERRWRKEKRRRDAMAEFLKNPKVKVVRSWR